MRVKHAVVLLMLISPLSWAGTMTFQFRNQTLVVTQIMALFY